ncbi:uncharacterized protein [Primulina huaijiensis]|uniref:uncharacterized protein isoform X3 n=1 Tax=Primulina huaijiensis TaxID=1492673 RepID=UPI003CC77B2D
MPGRMAGFHHFEEVDIAAAYISEHLSSMMASNDIINVHDHGIPMDPLKKSVKCNYCGKLVSGFHRLKCHLGAVGNDVRPCLKVPADVKEVFEAVLLEKKINNLKRSLSAPKGNVNINKANTQVDISEGDCLLENSGFKRASSSKKTKFSEVGTSSHDDSSEMEVKKSVGRFFYGTGHPFKDVEETFFLEMVSCFFGHGPIMNNIPSLKELKGWILEDSLLNMQLYVEEMRKTWETTGCSILLDGWIDSSGRNLVNILVYCPRGVIYLKSSDISSFVGNVDAMQLFLDEVLQDVGVENVVQIITYSTSVSMKLVGKRLVEKYKHFFWTVSASTCIELMLEKFKTMSCIENALAKARVIIEFVRNHASALKHLKDFVCIQNLVRPSKIKSIVPYLTLDSIVSKKELLKTFFVSSDWKTSGMSTLTEGKKVAGLVKNTLFWKEATMALKASMPLVCALNSVYNTNKPQTGFISKIISQAKGKIRVGFNHMESQYMPFWREIDEIWKNHLHISLHSAGCFLNPRYMESSSSDPNIVEDMNLCMMLMGRDPCVQDLVQLQVKKYQTKLELQIEKHRKREQISGESTSNPLVYFLPETWWSIHGVEYRELQRCAIRILSQTCDGASKFNLTRSFAELMLTNGDEQIEIKALTDLTYVHYNMRLQNFDDSREKGITIDEIDPQSGWKYDLEGHK